MPGEKSCPCNPLWRRVRLEQIHPTSLRSPMSFFTSRIFRLAEAILDPTRLQLCNLSMGFVLLYSTVFFCKLTLSVVVLENLGDVEYQINIFFWKAGGKEHGKYLRYFLVAKRGKVLLNGAWACICSLFCTFQSKNIKALSTHKTTSMPFFSWLCKFCGICSNVLLPWNWKAVPLVRNDTRCRFIWENSSWRLPCIEGFILQKFAE